MHIAAKLRESIAANQKSAVANLSGQLTDAVKEEQVLLAQHLQSALSVLQVTVLDQAPELATAISDQILQRMVEIATRLHEDLAVVVASAQVVLQQSDVPNCETQQDSLKELLMDEQLITMTHQEKKDALGEHAGETITESNIVILEESQLKDHAKETKVSFEHVVSMDSVDSDSIVEIKQAANEIISPENVAVGEVKITSLNSEALVLIKPFVATEQPVIDNTKGMIVDDGKPKEDSLSLKTEVTMEENVTLADSNKEAVGDVIGGEDVMDTIKPVKAIDVTSPEIGNSVLFKLYINHVMLLDEVKVNL